MNARGRAALVCDFPAAWGRLETGSTDSDVAHAAFDAPAISTFRGVGPWALVRRVELTKPA
jgi:hypothetical protein